MEAVRGCDAVVHFAGHPREQSFEEIVADTLPASYHIFEGARLHGCRRVVYASSIHAVGFYPVEAVPDTRVMQRPDTFYGLTKTFTENLASLYWDKFGLESVMLRICTCREAPVDRRMLWSWLSLDDCVRLVTAALTAPRVGFSVIYGTSDNARAAVSNAFATHIGFQPEDSADGYSRGGDGGDAAARPDRRRQPRGRRRLRRHRPSRRCRLTPGRSAPPSPPPGPPPRSAAPGPGSLRRGAGGGNRASAASLDAARADADPGEAEAAMRAWGQPPLFRIWPGEAALDARLAARGYVERDPTLILAAPAAAVAVPPGEAAVFGSGPLACMAEIWAAGGIGPARLAVMARVPEPRCYLLGRLDDRPAGAAFVALAGRFAVLHALEVAPFARRHGLGARMTAAAAHWAHAQGAETLALAVTRANASARALYGRLGLAEVGLLPLSRGRGRHALRSNGGHPQT